MSTERYVRDADIDARTRASLREFTTDRVALDGTRLWLLDEIESEHDDEQLI